MMMTGHPKCKLDQDNGTFVEMVVEPSRRAVVSRHVRSWVHVRPRLCTEEIHGPQKKKEKGRKKIGRRLEEGKGRTRGRTGRRKKEKEKALVN